MKHTPGPWAWFANKHQVYLATPDRGRLFVMGFARMGMRSAQPMFATWEGEDRERLGGYMMKAQEIDVPNHPDARLIASAPDLLEALKEVAHHADDEAGFMVKVRDAIAKAEGQSEKG